MTHLLLTNFVCVKVGQDFMKGGALFVSCCSSCLGRNVQFGTVAVFINN